ncbi:RelA/SpoT domain-containing protein, partial [Vibrio vulnificus]
MSKETFLEQWLNDKPMYEAWGKFVTSKILEQLVSKGYNVSSYLKQPAIPRVKEDDSLIDKAFYRPGKEYSDPYNDIEDKVGVRFVVLLLEQIEEINSIVTSSNDWIHKECRHFENERSKDPLIFTYQSVHYVVRASRDISFEGLL